MSNLLGTLQQSASALQVSQLGVQVVGNNIANTNTEGYIRQELQQASAIGVRQGNLVVGHGVRAVGVRQKVDQQLLERMFNAQTALSGAEQLRASLGQLEQLSGDLNGGGLGDQLSQFDAAIQELSTQPNDPSLREFVLRQADTLTNAIRTNRAEAVRLGEQANNSFADAANRINELTSRIADLNVEIATIEGGGTIRSDATGLRERRYNDLEELSKFVNLNIQEQDTGVVNVFVGGDYLVSNGIRREVYTAYNESLGGSEVRIVETDSPLQATGGLIAAAAQSRDGAFGNYVQRLDEVAVGLIRGFNEIHASGQGGRGFDSVTSTEQVVAGVPLPSAQLAFEPRNGSFDIQVRDGEGELISTHRIDVRNLGRVGDSTVNSIVNDINAIDGITARVNSAGQVEIDSDASTATFNFIDDNSGFLAAVGINTFFTGTSGLDIDVNAKLLEDSDYLAVSRAGIGADTEVLSDLIGVIDRPLEHLGGTSVRGRYEQFLTGIGQQIAVQQSSLQGLSDFHATLRSQHLAISGVNIDEESIKLIAYQRAFQASSRVISTASEMLELLVNL